MSAEFLPVFIGNAAFDIELLMPRVMAGEARRHEVLAFCRHYRTIGIGSVLLGEPPAGMARELSKSGHAFLHFLRAAADEDKLTSRAEPFFDAVAAGDFACAREIARHARTTCNPDREYEEDFLYVRWLMLRFLPDAAVAEERDLLERYAALLGEDEDPRFEVCVALGGRDAEALRGALAGVLDAEAGRYREQAGSGMLPQEVAATEVHVSIEGLALVNLAVAAGLATEREYARIPSLVRGPVPNAYPADAWTTS